MGGPAHGAGRGSRAVDWATRRSSSAKFEEPVAKVFDHILDDGPEVLSKMRDRIEATRSSNSKRFERFKEDVSDEIGKRHWYVGTGAKALGLVIAALVVAAVVLFWKGIAGFRPVAPRWNDIVLIALGVCAVINAVVLVIGIGNTKLWRRRTRDGQLEAQRWEAFRRYLSDFPRLDIAPPATLALWERFLVYGIAFGIAERVLQGAQLHMPEELPRRARSTGSARTATSARARARSRSATSRRASARRSPRRRRAAPAAPAAASPAAAVAAAAEAAAEPGELAPAAVLVESDRAGDRDVERLRALGHRDRRGRVAPLEHL